MILDTFELM